MTPAFIAADAAQRAADLDAIRAGLAGPEEDRWYWRGRAERRRQALEDDAPVFGLLPHEEAELEALRELMDMAA